MSAQQIEFTSSGFNSNFNFDPDTYNVGVGLATPQSFNGGVGTILNIDSSGEDGNTVLVLSSNAASGSDEGGIFEVRSNLSDEAYTDGKWNGIGQFAFGRSTDVTEGQISSTFTIYVNNDGTPIIPFTVQPSGVVYFSYGLDISGGSGLTAVSAAISGDETVGGTLGVTSNTTIGGTLSVTGGISTTAINATEGISSSVSITAGLYGVDSSGVFNGVALELSETAQAASFQTSGTSGSAASGEVLAANVSAGTLSVTSEYGAGITGPLSVGGTVTIGDDGLYLFADGGIECGNISCGDIDGDSLTVSTGIYSSGNIESGGDIYGGTLFAGQFAIDEGGGPPTYGASGSFVSADDYNVEVLGGIIVSIS